MWGREIGQLDLVTTGGPSWKPLPVVFTTVFSFFGSDLAPYLWLWLARAEKNWCESTEASTHGFLLGAVGAFAGFAASSLVNYNLGDAETALMIWWLLGTAAGVMNDKKLRGAIT